MDPKFDETQRYLGFQPFSEEKKEEEEDDEETAAAALLLEDGIADYRISPRTLPHCPNYMLLLLLSMSFNIFLTCWVTYAYWPVERLLSHGILSGTPTAVGAYYRFTEYSSREGNNTAVIQTLWNDMITDHGFVALDHEWAKQNDLPRSRTLPSDTSKGIYFIEAYHALHCLVTIREAHYHLTEHGNEMPLSRSAEHYSHCFDTVKQTLTCNAADNLFAVPITEGAIVYGDEGVDCKGCFEGQPRQCRAWGKLRDWATKYSPCIGNTRLNEETIAHHFCLGPDDGIRLYD